MADSSDIRPDFADVAVAHWERERPDLDFTAMATLARFARLHIAGSRRVDAVFAAHGLDRGEFDVLASLRRTGAPHEMPPSQLAEILLITRAGMTKRVDRLEARGLVTRRADPEDRRSLRICLTPEGIVLVDAAVTEHAANENRLLSLLTEDEAHAFDATLRKLLAAVEEHPPEST
ncbi:MULTISPECIES: MarR family winged helix-turn-helix transcriptional regulator [unclassified Streptomyces]|uniref:MarR family winged helix-turn-helix transcriptional regulator n=1 Tax=unclassified Streptomyces TaxID=2593676 RepID=UPI000CD53A2E|nr:MULTISPECIES: MarR family transcriptional regulator [unclassified Streptomyces]MCI4040373.1 MarR family transcriptional regulator [Streptomyces sp. TRM75563]